MTQCPALFKSSRLAPKKLCPDYFSSPPPWASRKMLLIRKQLWTPLPPPLSPLCLCVGGREGVNVCFIRSPHKRRQCGKHLWEKHRTINCTTYRVTVQHEHGAHLSKLPVLLNNELTAAAIHSALTNFQFSLRLQLTELHGIHFLKFLPGFTALSFLPLLLVCLWWWNLIHCHYLSIWWNQSGQAPTKSPAWNWQRQPCNHTEPGRTELLDRPQRHRAWWLNTHTHAHVRAHTPTVLYQKWVLSSIKINTRQTYSWWAIPS